MKEKEYLEAIIKPLLKKPEAFSVSRIEDDLGVLLTVDVDKYDVGRIIGKEGSIVKSIRSLMYIWGMNNQMKLALKINEPVGGKFNQ